MTEIIDGVDVSGCCLYKDGICLTDKGKCTSMCDYGAYAREEKLKRLETENAKLKELLETRCYNEVEFENKKLKEALEEIREMAIYDCVYECSNNSEKCTIGSCLEKRIERKINEVLKDE